MLRSHNGYRNPLNADRWRGCFQGVESVAEAQPGQGEVWIEQEAIGVNYLDVTQRNGSVPIALPSGLGLEAAGRVAAIGPDVVNVAVGDRVVYILEPIGGYASGRLYPVERLVRLPDLLSVDDAAAILFKGVTAHYLLHSTYADGRLDIRWKGHSLSHSVFDKDQRMTQATIVDNKRLGEVLTYIKERQDQKPVPPVKTNSEKHGYKPTGRKPGKRTDYINDPDVIARREKALLQQQAAQ